MDGIFITVAVVWFVCEAVRMDRKTGHARRTERRPALLSKRHKDNVIPFRKKAS